MMSDFTSHKSNLPEFLNQYKVLMMTQNNDIMKEDMENMLLKQIKNAVRRSADYKVFHEVAWLAPTLKDHK